MTREDRADLDRLNKSSSEGASYNPFASFFGSDAGEQGEVQADPSAKKKATKKKATKKKATKKKATKKKASKKAEEKGDPQPASEPASEKDS